MTHWMLAAAFGLAALPQQETPPAHDAPPVILEAPSTSATSLGSKTWIGHEAALQEYLRSAPIERIEDIPVGVTKPRRAFFVAGGLAGSAAVKFLPPSVRGGFWESYKSEIAAYELDLLLGLRMVPVTVERRVGSDKASVQVWVERCRVLKDVDQKHCPRPVEWAKQVCRQRVFDNLIANVDRNAGNMLVDGEWNMVLIDHSRAFAQDRMPFVKEMTRVDREFFAALKALDEASLMQRLRPWTLGDKQIREILKRRDRIVTHFEQLARERGEQVVFPF